MTHAPRNSFWIIVSQPVRQVVAFAVAVVMTRILTPEDYGILAAAQVLVGYLALFSTLGLYDAGVQKPEMSDDDAHSLFSANVLAGLLFTGVSLLSTPVIRYFFGRPELSFVIPALSCTFLLNAFGQFHGSLLARDQSYGRMICVDIGAQVGGAAIAISLALTGAGYWSLVALQLSACTIRSILSWLLTTWRPRRFTLAGWLGIRQSIRFGMGVSAGNILNYMSGQVDRLVLGRRSGAIPLGLYARSQQLGQYGTNLFFIGPHRFVTARLAHFQHDDVTYRKELLRILGIALWVSIPVACGLAVSARGLVNLLFTAKWDAMYPIFYLFSLGNAAYVMAYAYQWVFTSRGKGRRLVQLSGLRLLIACIGVAIAFRWGVFGLAAAYSIGLWLTALITSRACAHELAMPYLTFMRPLLLPTVLIAPWVILAQVVFPTTDAAWLPILYRSAIIGFPYIALSFIFDRSTLVHTLNLIPGVSLKETKP